MVSTLITLGGLSLNRQNQVPYPPRTLMSRLKLLEDHIIKLEKEYPPWAALHFNQPNRGVCCHYFSSSFLANLTAIQWPPPPRTTPIIVPPNLRSKEQPDMNTIKDDQDASTPGPVNDKSVAKSITKQKSLKSSLHRAVMEKLQVQQAMNDLEGSS